MNGFCPDHHRLTSAFRRALAACVKDQAGVAAVEFALLLPIFAFLYLMAFQTSVGFSTANKVSRAASTIADLVTQQDVIDTGDLDDMYELSKAIIAPYSVTGLTVKVSGLKLDAAGDATVDWSWKNDGSRPYSIGLAVSIPGDLKVANAFLVRAEVQTTFNYLFFVPSMTDWTSNSITIGREFYFRQRVGAGVICSDC